MPSKRKGRRSEKSNYISMGFAIKRKPPGVGPAEFFKVMRQGVRDGYLPGGYEVEVRWRNKRGGEQLRGDFEETISASRASWKQLLGAMFRRAQGRLQGEELRTMEPARSPKTELAPQAEVAQGQTERGLSAKKRAKKTSARVKPSAKVLPSPKKKAPAKKAVKRAAAKKTPAKKAAAKKAPAKKKGPQKKKR